LVKAVYKSTFQLLRLHFSIFLLPVYLFALSQLVYVDWSRAVLVFCILHLLVYPASNGYNSYMDRDEGPIGGLKNPPKATKQLLYVTIFMDIAAIILGLMISYLFSVGVLLYILASRAYSYRGIRLKKYPVAGYLVVVIFQGAVCFFLSYHGCSAKLSTEVPTAGLIASSLLVGGSYPLTQIYQHQQDLDDGVHTISYQLGYKGTFIFAGIIYALAFGTLGFLFFSNLEPQKFFILQIFMVPVLVYFFWWAKQVWKDGRTANFENTMRMNLIASTCTNLGFLTLIMLKWIE
jgi:1,4-dihydroxy-2-naphthoate polyprenyltransferase